VRAHDIPEEFLREVGLDTIDAIDAVPRELPTPPPFPVGTMPEGCRRLITEAALAIGCPPDFVALPMLAVLGSAIGNSRVLRLKRGWEEGTAIYSAVIADPGEKKSPALKVALEPAKRAQAAKKEDYERKAEEHKRKKREYEVEKRDAAKDGVAAPPPPLEPTMERTLVEDITVERLAGIQAENPRGVVAIRDELSGWARGMDQYKQGGRGADRQFWLSAWSNSYISVDRKSQPHPLIVSRPFVALFGAIQPDVLPELGEGREDGLLDRFLFAYPYPVAAGWTDDEISEEAESSYASLYAKLRELYMPKDELGEPEPVCIHLAPDAKDSLIDAINLHRSEMYAPGFPARLKGPWSKLEGYLARLILILATARAADTGAAERVEVSDVLAAASLVEYFKGHAKRVYVGLHGHDEDELLAADIASFLTERGGHFKDEPGILFEQLSSQVKPPRPDELTKRLKAIAAKTKAVTFNTGNFWKDEQSRRFVELFLGDGVNGVNGVKGEE